MAATEIFLNIMDTVYDCKWSVWNLGSRNVRDDRRRKNFFLYGGSGSKI